MTNLVDRGSRGYVDGACAVLCVAGLITVLVGASPAIRAPIAVTASLLGTGWLLACWIPKTDIAFLATAAVAFGIAAYIFVSMFFVYVGFWHPVGVGEVILALDGVGSAVLAAVRLSRRAE